MKIITDLSECEQVWNTFSPHITIWDEWEVALSFFEESQIKLQFIQSENGVLPLQKENSTFYLFGNDYTERTTFWFPIQNFANFYDALPDNTILLNMDEDQIAQIKTLFPQFESQIFADDTNYSLNLAKLEHNMSNYLAQFSSKHRKNLRYDLEKVSAYKVCESDLSIYDTFIQFNIDRFGENSDFTSKDFAEKFKLFLTTLQKRGELIVLTLQDENNKVVAIEICAKHKETFYVLNGGYTNTIKNIGKKMIFETIAYAISQKYRTIDFLAAPKGSWKELWNLEATQLYSVHKNLTPENAQKYLPK